MLELSTVDFNAAVRPLGADRLQAASERLFEAWDREVDDFGIYLELEEGSLKGKGRIRATAIAVLLAIDHFDGIVGGIEKIADGGRRAASYLAKEVHSLVEAEHGVSVRVRRGAGDVGQLDLLFRKVRTHQMEPAEAEEELIRLLSKQPDITPDMLERLRHALLHAPRHPKQLGLDFGDPYDLSDTLDDEAPQPRKRRAPQSPSEPAPAPPLYRVEIWRESKKGKRNVTLHPL